MLCLSCRQFALLPPRITERGAFFGELALLNNAPRAATCKAAGDVTLLALRRDEFEMISNKLTQDMKATHEARGCSTWLTREAFRVREPGVHAAAPAGMPAGT